MSNSKNPQDILYPLMEQVGTLRHLLGMSYEDEPYKLGTPQRSVQVIEDYGQKLFQLLIDLGYENVS